MKDEGRVTCERTILRIGAVCAILGAVVSVAAGMGFGNLTNEYGTEQVLRTIAARPRWYWPTVHLGFIVGAFLWVGAFVALAVSLKSSVSWALGWLGAATVIVGAAIHVADSSISGFGLNALAGAWASAPAPEQSNLLRVGDTLLYLLNGTWRSVHSYFHGVPFILSGAAVALSRRYPPVARLGRCRRRHGLIPRRSAAVSRRRPRFGTAGYRARPGGEPVDGGDGSPDVA